LPDRTPNSLYKRWLGRDISSDLKTVLLKKGQTSQFIAMSVHAEQDHFNKTLFLHVVDEAIQRRHELMQAKIAHAYAAAQGLDVAAVDALAGQVQLASAVSLRALALVNESLTRTHGHPTCTAS
jgi:hypothetical protein